MSVLEQLIKRPGLKAKFLRPEQPSTRALDLSRTILQSLLGDQSLSNVNVRLWDGSLWPDETPRAATVVLNRPSALREMLFAGTETGMGEAYVNAAFDVEGDFEAAFELGDRIVEKTNGWTRKLEIGNLLRQLPAAPSAEALRRRAALKGSRHSHERDREAISFHYNVSNDFYSLWLDREMAYSCAYFHEPTEDLDAAQRHKFDHICRKLGLREGQRFLDIGCGWGGLVAHAARYYGVRAEGITLSQNQLDFARRKLDREGLADRVSLSLTDYRDLPDEPVYDAVASVGMVEHIGREKLPTYFRKVLSLLKPGGLFLNHGIGVGAVRMLGDTGTFINEHVFPDSDLIRISEMLNPAETEGWEIRDVENLREHYALTLRHWVQRLETQRDQALEHVNEATYRVWRLYMAGCAHNFAIGKLAIYQTLQAKLSPHGTSRAPAVRAGWYK
jgi:cyclopropane-fatty-acyl-phospholipid synthase